MEETVKHVSELPKVALVLDGLMKNIQSAYIILQNIIDNTYLAAQRIVEEG